MGSDAGGLSINGIAPYQTFDGVMELKMVRNFLLNSVRVLVVMVLVDGVLFNWLFCIIMY